MAIMSASPSTPPLRGRRSSRQLAGFAVYAVVSLVHVLVLAARVEGWAQPTKLALMPGLMVATAWAALARTHPGHGVRKAGLLVLVAAQGASWLGDGAGTFFPSLPTLPLMLGWFGMAHLLYVWLFCTSVGRHRVRLWALVVYPVWWFVMIAVVGPRSGGLFWGLVGYGLVLAATAITSTRGGRLLAVGGALFLASDTILAFQLFLDPPWWTSPLVMATYTAGQGLIAFATVHALRWRP